MNCCRRIIVLTAAITLLLMGCSQLPPAHTSIPNPAQSILLNGSLADAFEVARDALLANGITPRSGSPELGYVKGDRGASAWSWGELVGVYFQEDEAGKVRLWPVSKPKLATNVVAPDWTVPLILSLRESVRRNEEVRGRSPEQSRPSPERTAVTGTGFFIGEEGIVVTALHVVDGAQEIKVRTADGQWFPAQILKRSHSTDIAILGLECKSCPFLRLADMAAVRQGQRVFTLGYPVAGVLGDEVKYTDGVISSLSGTQGDGSLLQVTVPIQPGNSGGPLLNEKGEVIGVVTSSAAVATFLRVTGTLPQNVNWAVKGSYVSALWASTSSSASNGAPGGDVVEMAREAVVFVTAE